MMNNDISTVDALIALLIVLIMFSIGLTLKLERFKEIIHNPKDFTVGIVIQIMALPTLAFLLCHIFNISNDWKAGLFILALCPGGTTSNFISYMISANTELSVAMTSINGFITLFTIPVLSNFALRYFQIESNINELPYVETVIQLVVVAVLPVIIGVIVSCKFPRIAKFLNKAFTLRLGSQTYQVGFAKLITISVLCLVFIIKLLGAKSSGGVELSKLDVQALLPTVLTFNFIGLGMGYLIAKIFRLSKLNSITISIEIGLQNASLAFLVIGGLLSNTEMQKPVLLYALISFWTASIFAVLLKKIVKE